MLTCKGLTSLLLRAFEFAVLFIAVPAFIVWRPLPVYLIPVLLVIAGACYIALSLDPKFDRRQLWIGRATWREIPRILLLFMLGAALIAGGVLLFEPKSLFSLIKHSPRWWAIIMILYPVCSVYPQELIYRVFFFHRYQILFRNSWAMIAVNAAAFGYMHIVMRNWTAVALCVGGGALFAYTYSRTRSAVMVWFEHTLFGCLIFTIGLGHYFFVGSPELARQIIGQ
ncbi:MAG: CPBP family intramembrane metalloprotease [Candidatus Sumerlaeota bacterium]|nr:CPBP family intramembrane metalloprotease [Candidatus Sumerlaeota bacterium]